MQQTTTINYVPESKYPAAWNGKVTARQHSATALAGASVYIESPPLVIILIPERG
jgi:hypothetical protein